MAAWDLGARFVLLVSPTGSGKTVTFADIILDNPGPTCAIAHRQELVGQMSLALAFDGIRHAVIAPTAVVRACVARHVQECGRSYYDAAASVAVAGVKTILRRDLDHWAKSVTLWVMDEAHHLLRDNQWGKAVGLFPNARGFGVTATPKRADGQGLGAHASGVFEVMVEGPDMRHLIDQGYLTDYRIFAPAGDLNREDLKIGSTGDFTGNSLRAAVKKSHIIGDIVEHYLKIAPGKLGVTFTTDIETATSTAEAYNAAGVPAAVVSAKTPDRQRTQTIEKFRRRELLQLVNVDIFGEGFDLPAIEVVSMARPTESYGLYVQQFGRALRIMDGKTQAIVIDHVGNVVRHGLPDDPKTWTLNSEDRQTRNKTDEIPLRACPECAGVYERVHIVCPWCGYKPEPAERSTPEQVDGDLAELTPEILAAMRADVDRVDMDPEEYRAELVRKGCPNLGVLGHVNKHKAKQEAQAGLRESMAVWAGGQRALGRVDSESYRRFFFGFGVDVLSAKALGTADAEDLTKRILTTTERATC